MVTQYFRLKPAGDYQPGKPVDIAHAAIKFPPVYRNITSKGSDYKVRFPVNWSDTINPDPSWRLWFQSLTWLEPYLSSNNSDSVFTAFKIIGDWVNAHVQYPVPGEKFAFDDHAVSERLVVLQHAYQRYGTAGIEDKQFQSELLLSILTHIFFISSLERYTSWHNHAIIFDEKLISALKELNEFTMRTELLNLSFARVFEQYRYAFTSEGVHKEHSPCYHNWLSSALSVLMGSADELKITVPASLRQIQKNSVEYSRVIGLNGANLPIGDCARHEKKSKWNGKRNSPTVFSLKCRLFPLSGWMYVYDSVNKINIVAQSDFFGYSHYQQDETSFTLSTRNYEMIIDPGLYSYMQSPVYEYYRSTRAHNMLVVDGIADSVDQTNTGLSGISRFYQESDDNGNFTGAVEMTHSLYKKHAIEVYRQFFFPGGYEMVIRDVVSSREQHSYSQLFHLAPGAEISKTADGFDIKWKDNPDWLMIRSNHDTYTIVEGQNEPMQGWYFPAFNQIEEAPVLVLQKKGKQCEFVSRISLVTAGGPEGKQSWHDEKYVSLRTDLERVKRREMVHLPFPGAWKPVQR